MYKHVVAIRDGGVAQKYLCRGGSGHFCRRGWGFDGGEVPTGSKRSLALLGTALTCTHIHRVCDQEQALNLSGAQLPYFFFFFECLRLTKNEKIRRKSWALPSMRQS